MRDVSAAVMVPNCANLYAYTRLFVSLLFDAINKAVTANER